LYHISLHGTADHQKEELMVLYENAIACPSVRKWTKTKGLKLANEEAEFFLYFLDKYMTVMVVGPVQLPSTSKTSTGTLCWID
jgi:hypothetical protein